MSVFKWSINHKARRADVQQLIETFGFKPTGDKDHMYAHKISAGTYWREMKVRLRPEEAVFFLLKEEESTTETYFDYLVKASFLMGQLAGKIELLPVKDEGVELPEADYDDEEDEDEELAQGETA